MWEAAHPCYVLARGCRLKDGAVPEEALAFPPNLPPTLQPVAHAPRALAEEQVEGEHKLPGREKGKPKQEKRQRVCLDYRRDPVLKVPDLRHVRLLMEAGRHDCRRRAHVPGTKFR